jgi:hypothetical protein
MSKVKDNPLIVLKKADVTGLENGYTTAIEMHDQDGVRGCRPNIAVERPTTAIEMHDQDGVRGLALFAARCSSLAVRCSLLAARRCSLFVAVRCSRPMCLATLWYAGAKLCDSCGGSRYSKQHRTERAPAAHYYYYS